MPGRRVQTWVGMSSLALAAVVLSLGPWGGVQVGGLSYFMALVLSGAAVAFLGSPPGKPSGLIYIPLVVGLVMVIIPTLGTGHRAEPEMTAVGLLLLLCWVGLLAVEQQARRRVAVKRAAQDWFREAVSEDLARARRLLPPPEDPDRLSRLDEMVLRGELAAALGELEALGLLAGAPIEYWRALSSAAWRMGLNEVHERLARLGGEAVSDTPP